MAEVKSKKILPVVLVIVTVGLVGFTAYRIFSLRWRGNPTREELNSLTSKLKTVPPETSQTAFAEIPIYSGAMEVSKYSGGAGEVQVSYETKPGVTAKEILDFYRQWLNVHGWQIAEQSGSQITALSSDEIRLRVWIFFTGAPEEGLGATYNIDYYPPAAGPLPPISLQ